MGCPPNRREKARPLFEGHYRVPSLYPKRSSQALRPGPPPKPYQHSFTRPCMARPKKTRPRGACSKAAGDESRRTTIQCTLATPHTHPARSPAFTPFLEWHSRKVRASLRMRHARPQQACPMFPVSRSPLARPLPCVDSPSVSGALHAFGPF